MKKSKIYLILICFTMHLFFFTGGLFAQTTNPATGEEELFNASNDPDALILLDLSGSMDENPRGSTTNIYGNSTCSGTTFKSSSQTGYTTNCRKISIAKQVLFNVLDDNNDSTVNSNDRSSMGVRFGYMRFTGCDSSSQETTKGYGSNGACAADLVNCSGTVSGIVCGRTDGFCNKALPSSTIYTSSAACPGTADTFNCSGPSCGRTDGFCNSPLPINTTTYYASSSCSTPDTTNCIGTSCNRTDGYCNSSIAGPAYYASTSCSTANDDYGNCTGNTATCGRDDGFCSHSIAAKTVYAHDSSCTSNTSQCRTKTWAECTNGYCPNPHSDTTHSCRVLCPNLGLGCTQSCTGTGCHVGCTTTTGCTNPCTSTGCNIDCEGGIVQSWTTGCNTLVAAIDTLYSCIYCQNLTTCTSSTTTKNCSNTSSIANETASGRTPACLLRSVR